MNSSLRLQASAFALSVVTTLGLMASIDHLAATPAPADQMAQAVQGTAPLQVVVVTAKRLSANS